jgi:hypothetical protein
LPLAFVSGARAVRVAIVAELGSLLATIKPK